MKLCLRFAGILAGSVALAACADAGGSSEDVARIGEAVTVSAGLEPVANFGANPAGLVMYRYVPAGLPAGSPLVLVLHGCGQGAADMVNAGWNTMADKLKFAVAYPEQTITNNAAKCFNWAGVFGNPANLKRGQGENESIKEMVDKMKTDVQSDAKRVFIVGFSSGGAEAALMLATWPDVFAAGATFSGIPYDCAESVAGASSCMKPGKDQDAKTWGDLARAGDSSYTGPWPRLSIWQGTADTIVDPTNTKQMMRQWTSVHGVAQTPSASDTVQGFPHDVYKDGTGQVVVETYAITGKDHGIFVDPAGGCGTAAPYVLDAKICSAQVVSHFFGLDGSGTTPPGDGGTMGAADGAAASSGGTGSHDAGSPGSGGYGGGSSGTSGSSGKTGQSGNGATSGSDAGEFGGAIPPSSGLAGCSIGFTKDGAGTGALGLVGFGAALGLATLRRRSRKTGK